MTVTSTDSVISPIALPDSVLVLIFSRLLDCFASNHSLKLGRKTVNATVTLNSVSRLYTQAGFASNRFFHRAFEATRLFVSNRMISINSLCPYEFNSFCEYFKTHLNFVYFYSDVRAFDTLELNIVPFTLNAIHAICVLRPTDFDFLRPSSRIFCGSLKHLSIEFLNDEGPKLLSDALKSNYTLRSLHLGSNNIRSKGAMLISDALKVNRSLTSVDLWGNNIRSKGVKFVSDALRVNRSLTSVDLWGNSIDDEGVKAIAFVLKINNTIEYLNLHHNSITSEGVTYLIDALTINTSLIHLNLCDNFIDDETKELMIQLFGERVSVKTKN
ncbi:hypothetical protein GEMRC1_006591 [Eukaryota sp. GEM-RC1]